MTMSNSRIIYAAAGAPIHEVDGNESGMCAICGIDGVGVPFDDWLKDTFTDLDKLVHGSRSKQQRAPERLALYRTGAAQQWKRPKKPTFVTID